MGEEKLVYLEKEIAEMKQNQKENIQQLFVNQEKNFSQLMSEIKDIKSHILIAKMNEKDIQGIKDDLEGIRGIIKRVRTTIGGSIIVSILSKFL